jgi:hypothetical protein
MNLVAHPPIGRFFEISSYPQGGFGGDGEMAVFVHPRNQPEDQKEQVAVIPTGVRVMQENGRLIVYDAENVIVGDFGPVIWWYVGHTSPSVE